MNLNQIKTIFFLAFIFIVISCGNKTEKDTTQNKEKKTKPNIVFIMSDDHAYQAISAYGHDLNHTPNIDRIANEGAIFKRGFVTNSICAPSRAVMLTGKHSHINGKVDNILPFNWKQDNFAKQLQKSGYQTALIGKIHLHGFHKGFIILTYFLDKDNITILIL